MLQKRGVISYCIQYKRGILDREDVYFKPSDLIRSNIDDEFKYERTHYPDLNGNKELINAIIDIEKVANSILNELRKDGKE